MVEYNLRYDSYMMTEEDIDRITGKKRRIKLSELGLVAILINLALSSFWVVFWVVMLALFLRR